MQRILIIGATSAIAEATARIYSGRGAELFLVGRNAARLRAICNDLLVRGANSASEYVMDVNAIANHAAMLDAAWSVLRQVDVVLIAHGTLPDQAACESSVELSMQEFATNCSSTIALATAIVPRLQSPSTLAVISSVAGDRGRSSNYLYGSAKAAVTAFLSGLRQRHAGSGMSIVTIKPGFVDTPMTQSFKKGRLWAKPDQIARGIVKSIDRRRTVVYLPWFWWPIMTVIRNIPEAVFSRVRL